MSGASLGRTTRLRNALVHVITSVAAWLLGTLAFGWWVRRIVDEEYRSGARTPEMGDAIMIPIAGFAMLLAAGLVVANASVVAVRWWRRRGVAR